MQRKSIGPEPIVMAERHAQQLFDGIAQLEGSGSKSIYDLLKLAGMDPTKDLVGKYLGNYDLSGVDLSGVNLSEADLSGANLTEANLELTQLSRANLENSDLTGAILRGANLEGARVVRAKLVYCDFSNANIVDADFSGADVSEIKLQEDPGSHDSERMESLSLEKRVLAVRAELQRRGALVRTI